MKLSTLDKNPLVIAVSLTLEEFLGYLKSQRVLVLEVAEGYVIGTVNQVTCSRNSTILIMDLIPKHGDLKSIFTKGGTLYLESTDEDA